MKPMLQKRRRYKGVGTKDLKSAVCKNIPALFDRWFEPVEFLGEQESDEVAEQEKDLG